MQRLNANPNQNRSHAQPEVPAGRLESDRAAIARAMDGRAALARAARSRAAIGIDDGVLDIVVDRLLADLDAMPESAANGIGEPDLVLTTASSGAAFAFPRLGPLASVGGRSSVNI